MNDSTKRVLAAAACGVLLLGGAGMFVTLASGSATGVLDVGPQEWADLIVAIGLIGYTAALLVAAFGKRRARYGPG